MKIKQQSNLLIFSIIAIPLICLFFVFVDNYFHSTDRYLINGYKEVRKIEREKNKDYNDALDIIEEIPPEIGTCLIATDSLKVIYNTIPELENIPSTTNLWDILSKSSKEYFYQFTSPATTRPVIIITRIPRKQPDKSSFDKLIYSILIVFSITLFICVISILHISKTVFNSILKIKDETKSIANGKLNQKIVIDENKKNYNEIMSILESLEIMRNSLSEAEKRKSNFIMGISHDLRTPVAIIKGYIEAITDNVITDEKEVKEALSLIQNKTNQLESMINELISFTKLDSYELREKLEPNSITTIIKTFARESELSANVYDRKIICDINLPENIYVPLNKQLILRTFENLFSNALRYTKDGDKIKIISFIQDNEIVLKIEDTGIGISSTDLPHIFDLFYKSSNSRQGQSMGIGLAVVKNVLDTHGWDIDVFSEKGMGTCFTIFIPIEENYNISSKNLFK